MATPTNAPMAGEIWHLSIEDLFQPVQEAPRLGGDGPFVINLSVSTAPISVPTKAIAKNQLHAKVYQIQVTEDGRTRYRLRLGPFASEDQADAVLAEVRDTYPAALTATASSSDLRVIATLQAKADHRPAAPKAADLVEKFLAQRSPSARAASEGAQTATPQTAAVPESDGLPKLEVTEISIDIAWPTPALAAPPSMPTRAATVTAKPATAVTAKPAATVTAKPAAAVTAKPASAVIAKPAAAVAAHTVAITNVPSPVSAASAPKLDWHLPELDVPLPAIQKPAAAPAAPVAPVASATAAVAPAAEPFELKLAPPFSVTSVAPVLTEVVTLSKAPARKNAAQQPAVIAAPVLTEAVAPKIKAPSRQPAPSAPSPKQTMAAPPKPAAPKSVPPAQAANPAPVLTQTVAPARKNGPKFQASPGTPMANKRTSLQHVVVATAPVPAAREVKKLDEPLESLESTQTIRALTPKEIEDSGISRWFVIQLALADHAFDPDAVPNLDLFREYRLYSVAGLDQGRVVHALRLGFFREEIGAVAVASYLTAYWDKPTIKRVSVAERERFVDQRVEARKDVGATGKHAIIEITDELVARRRRSAQAAAVKASNPPIEH